MEEKLERRLLAESVSPRCARKQPLAVKALSVTNGT